MLKYSIVNNFLNSPLILIKFVSKFMVCKFLYFEAQHAFRLRSCLIAGVLSLVKMNAIDFFFQEFHILKTLYRMSDICQRLKVCFVEK